MTFSDREGEKAKGVGGIEGVREEKNQGEKATNGGEQKAMTEVKSNLVLLVGLLPTFPPQVQLRPTPAARHQGQ